MSTRPILPPSVEEHRAELARDFRRALALRAAVAGDWQAAAQNAEALPRGDRLARIIRGAVGAIAVNDAAALTAHRTATLAWLASLRQTGIFDRLLPDMRPAILESTYAVSSTALTADETEEGGAAPVRKLTLSSAGAVTTRKATVMVAITRELARLSAAAELLDRELRDAVVAATDSGFLTALYNTSEPIASTNAVDDIDALLAAVDLGVGSTPYFVFGVAAAKALATQRTSGVRQWPEMTPLGGSIVGIEALVSDQIPANGGLLVDASIIAADAGSLDVLETRQADFQMNDAPDDSPSASTVPTSLWQHNMVGIRAARYYGFRVLRSSGVKALSGISY